MKKISRSLFAMLASALLTPALGAQSSANPSFISHSQLGGVVIDAAAIVRESGVQTLADLLASRVPGLLVVPGSGLTGGGAQIRLAGPRTMVGQAAPLVVVDGIRIDAAEDASVLPLGGPGPLRLEDISVEDIETVEVIRGPGAATLYGPGAAAGVIAIKTKRGASGPMRWETYGQGAMLEQASAWPTNYGGVDADNANPAMRSGGCNLISQASGACVQDYVQAFNPLVERRPFDSPFRRRLGVSATGGPRWGAFRIAGGAEGNGGAYAMPGFPADFNDYRRWHVQGSGTVQPAPSVDLGLTAGRMSSTLGLPAYGPVAYALMGPSDSTGFAWDPAFQYAGTQKADRMMGAVEVNARPAPWLAVRARLGLDDSDARETNVVPGWRFEGRRRAEHRTAQLAFSTGAWNWRGLQLATTVGVERLGHRLERTEQVGPDGPTWCEAMTPCAFSSTWWIRHSTGAYLLQTIGVGERLAIDAAVRHDRFSELQISTTHPSVAVAWVARPDGAGLLGRVRLRAGYGSSGGLPGLGVEDPSLLVFLPPERTTSAMFSAEAGLLGGRWNAHLTAYAERSDANRITPVASSTGYFFAYGGETEISNQGVVATLEGAFVDAPAFGWRASVSVWGNRNRVTKLDVPPSLVSPHGLIQGYPVGAYWGERVIGYDDANGDGIITGPEVIVGGGGWAGTPYPTQGVALTSSLRFGSGWRLSATLDYRAGHHLFNSTAWRRCATAFAVCLDRNDPATPLADQAVAAGARFWGTFTEYIEDADYLKVRELWLTYEVPSRTAARLGARSVSITLAARNLATWTGYSGADPEAASYAQPNSFSGAFPVVEDAATVPTPRSWSLRVRLAF